MGAWAVVALGFHLASRLAYVLGVGAALRRQDRRLRASEGGASLHAFRRFRPKAAIVMVVDCVSFIGACAATHGSLRLPVPDAAAVGAGVLLIVVGAGVKLWAALRLGFAACYWHKFFVPALPALPDPPGPYRFMKNPMYTLGYLYTYGVALVFASLPGLAFALFDQAAILVFYHRVEKPHFEWLWARGYEPLMGGD
jgi:protein-S-isoprenylcysteine O-methyltransferase Ste14